jgi:hypothetical protein
MLDGAYHPLGHLDGAEVGVQPTLDGQDILIEHSDVAPLLALLGLGFIVGNAPYLLLLSSSVPRELTATVQAVGRTTAQLGGALAYAFMLTLIAGFGTRALVRSAEAALVTPAAIEQQLSSLAAAVGRASGR